MDSWGTQLPVSWRRHTAKLQQSRIAITACSQKHTAKLQQSVIAITACSPMKQAYLSHASNQTSISVAWIPEYSKDKQAYLVHGYHNATETGVSGACRIPAILRFRQCLGHGEAARYSHLSHFMPSCLRKHQVQSPSNTKSAYSARS